MTHPAERVWELVSGLPTGPRERRLLMPFHAYIDDSGNEPQSPVYVLAGFIASVEQWAAFSTDWQAALDEAPRLEYFKMKEAASLHGQFGRHFGWTPAKRDDRLATFTRIIRKRVRVRVSVSIQHAHFEKYLKSIPVPQRRLASDNAYVLLFQEIVISTAAVAPTLGITEPCDFIFDEQGALGLEALLWWPHFKATAERASRTDLPKFIGSPPIFRDEKHFLPLQAADLYAWQVRRNFVENRVLWVPPSQVLRQLETISCIFRNYTEAEVMRLRDYLLEIGRKLQEAYPDIPLVHASRTGRRRPKPKRVRKKRGE